MQIYKIVCQAQFVVNENARDLPKCSKSLHFFQLDGEEDELDAPEDKANRPQEVCPFFAGFVLGMDERTFSRPGLLGYLPEIWPLRCSRRKIKPVVEQVE
jgi:hypothetical protein